MGYGEEEREAWGPLREAHTKEPGREGRKGTGGGGERMPRQCPAVGELTFQQREV